MDKLKREPTRAIIWPREDEISSLLEEVRDLMEYELLSPDSPHLSNKEILRGLLKHYLSTHGWTRKCKELSKLVVQS